MWRSSAISRVLLLVLSEGIEKEEEEELEPRMSWACTLIILVPKKQE